MMIYCTSKGKHVFYIIIYYLDDDTNSDYCIYTFCIFLLFQCVGLP